MRFTSHFLAAMMVLAASGSAMAQDAPTGASEAAHGGYMELGTSRDWTAIKFKLEDGSTACAIYARPVSSEVLEGGKVVNAVRGELAAYITWENGSPEPEAGVVSFLLGAPSASAAEGNTARVDDKTAIALFGFEDRLYPDPTDDKVLTAAMRKGMKMTVEAVLPDDRIARDVYSLRGVQRASAIAAEGCKDE